MSYLKLLMLGPANQEFNYNHYLSNSKIKFEDYPDRDSRIRIASIWKKFADQTIMILAGSALAITAITVILINIAFPPLLIANAVLLTAGTAWIIFSGVRSIQAKAQASVWLNDKKWPPEGSHFDMGNVEVKKNDEKVTIQLNNEIKPQDKKVEERSEKIEKPSKKKRPNINSLEKESEKACKDQDLDDEYTTIKTYTCSESKEKAYLNLADRYYQRGNVLKALEVMGNIYSSRHTEKKEAFYFKVAEDYYLNRDIKNALEVMRNIYSSRHTEKKEAFYFKVAEDYYLNRDIKNALEVMRNIYSSSNTEKKEAFYFKIAEDYYLNRDIMNALEVMRNIYSLSNTEKKEAFYFKIAEDYYLNQDFKNALEVIGNIYSLSNTKKKDKFYLKISEQYYLLGSLNEAYQSCKKIGSNSENRYLMMDKIIITHSQLSNHDEIIEIFRDVLFELLIKKFLASAPKDKDLYLVFVERVRNISSELAKQLYHQYGSDIKNGNIKQVINYITPSIENIHI